MSDHCGTTTEEGNAVCIPGKCGCSSESKSDESAAASLLPMDPNQPSLFTRLKMVFSLNTGQEVTHVEKIRSGLMFGIACVASPCCTALIVPLGLALLAGTPVAVWASANLGWVYGGLTLLSIASLVLGFRWMRQKSNSKNSEPKATRQPIPETIP